MIRTRTSAIAGIAIAGALLLGACSSDSDTSTENTTTTQAPTTGDTMKDKTDGTMMEEKTIVDIAAGNDDFSTLVDLVTAAGLAETLSGEGPFTVFAPTNEAFAKLPAETVAELTKPENKEQLAAVLTYHVVSGKVMAADVKPGEVETVNGAKITIAVDGGDVMVNESKVTATDIKASNGVIHVIDTVLIPPTN
jgi:uncharacterized surface protein with fasciclin (FAS1) repeats